MTAKVVEIRDRATFIPAIAVRLDPADEGERYLFARTGYGTDPATQSGYVIVVKLSKVEAQYDAYEWKCGRTMTVAHQFIAENFDRLKNGDVVDVEFILGERSAPREPERLGGWYA